MTTKDIYTSIAQSSGTSVADARRVTNKVFEAVTDTLRSGGSLTIKGFGNIRLSDTTAPEQIGSVERKEITAIRFRPSRILKNQFNTRQSIKKVAGKKIVSRKLKQIPKKGRPLFKGRKYQR